MRREHSAETLAIIILMHETGKAHLQISDHLKLAESTMTFIIHNHNKQPKHPLQLINRAGRPLKLEDQAIKPIIRHIEQNSYDNFKTIVTSSKSGQTIS